MNPPKSPIKPPHLIVAEGRMAIYIRSTLAKTIPDIRQLDAPDSSDRPAVLLSSTERLFYTPTMPFLLFNRSD
jgi:hypothetical protein